MVDLFLFDEFSRTRLRQRCRRDANGMCRFRLRDGSWVMLRQQEWIDRVAALDAAIRPSARALRWSAWLAIPFAILVMVVLSNFPPLRAFLEHLDFATGRWFAGLFSCGLPLSFATRHVIVVRRALSALEADLARRPRCEAPHMHVSKALNLLEILALVLVGPHLLVEIVGTIAPGAFLNTPWTGTRLDAFGYAGLAVFAALGWLRWRRTQTLGPTRTPSDASSGRRTDAFARAREADA